MVDKRKGSHQGFSLVELTMVIAVMGVLFMGIMALIQYSTKGMWFIKGGMEMTSKANEAMTFINQDFKNAKASSMGALHRNPGLEEPPQLANTPTGWAVLPADVTRMGYSGSNIKSGLLSVRIRNGATYTSEQFNVPANRNFILSSWIKYPGRMNLVRASDNTNLTGLVANTNAYWTHLSSTVAFGSAQTVKLNISVAPPSWAVCNTPLPPGMDKDITEMIAYKGRVYVGGWENGASYSYSGTDGRYEGSVWFGINPHVTSIGVFDTDGPGAREEELMFCGGFWDWGNARSWHQWQIFYNQGNGPGTWQLGWPLVGEYPQWNGGPPGPDSGWGVGRHFFHCGASYNGKLYVGTEGARDLAGGPFFGEARVYDPTGPVGGKWTLLFITPDLMVTSVCVYNNLLFIGTANSYGSWHVPAGAGQVYIHDILNNIMIGGGVSQQALASYPFNMVVFNGGTGDKLYIAAANLYIYDQPTNTWSNISTLGSVSSVCVYNNRLYVGNWAGNIYSSLDGVTFTAEPGIGQTVRRFCANSDGLLYSAGANGVWGAPTVRVLINEAYFDDVSLSPEQVVFDSSTVVNGVDNVYTYYTSKGTDITDYNRFRFYRLRYDTPSKKLFRETSSDGGTTWLPQGLSSDGTICERVKRFSIINHNQESFELELTLEIDVGSGKKKEYMLRSSVTPGIS
ncbi:MAG: prepilin-type N-terminal cleavage/methylation domain-containing protein [bacterium]|nr:prepilin-type N-terminal cleavage/methylation domain-containing protein [bacterium]